MRIMIDATPLLLRSAGVKSYLYHWMRALRESANGDSIETFPVLRAWGELDHERSLAGRWDTTLWIALLALSQRTGLPVASFAARGVDVFHCSNQVRRPPRRCRLTTTLHDLTCWLMPELHTRANVRADNEFARDVVCRADALIAVSESTRLDAIRHLGVAPRKVVTIHSGVAQSFFDVTGETARRAPEKYGLTKPYVLCAGTIEPRKNIDRLLDAWALLPGDLRQNFELVFVGPAGWSSEKTLARLESMNGVRWLGYVPEADLPGLTRGATLLAYPSLYEGFGFPAAQAMAAGVPVLTSNVSALPEVAGGAALLVEPRSVTGIATGVRRLLESPEERARLAAAGRARAEYFRWERCARESLEFFRRVSG